MAHRLLALLVALLLTALPAWAAPDVITGTVTYRERVALPDGASLRVTLVRLDTGAPVVAASADLALPGQPPFAFTLNLRSPLEANEYGVVAEILRGSAVLFRSAAPTPIGDADAPIALLIEPAQGSALLPVQPQMTAPDPTLVEQEWIVTSVGGRPVIPGSTLSLSLAADLRADGFGGCNAYFAEARVEDGEISFGPPATTRKTCSRDLEAQEAAFFAALAAISHYETEPGVLRLLDAAGVPLLGLVSSQEP